MKECLMPLSTNFFAPPPAWPSPAESPIIEYKLINMKYVTNYWKLEPTSLSLMLTWIQIITEMPPAHIWSIILLLFIFSKCQNF